MDKIRFLMSDTSAEITEACREALEQKGVEVTVVEKDGQKVLQKMLSVRPQVVLLDAFMPGLDALAVKQKYNAAGERHTSFFVTGAFQSEEMVQELLDEGFAYYFVKPFDENVLASRVVKVAMGKEKHHLPTSVDSDVHTMIIISPKHTLLHLIHISKKICRSMKKLTNSVHLQQRRFSAEATPLLWLLFLAYMDWETLKNICRCNSFMRKVKTLE